MLGMLLKNKMFYIFSMHIHLKNYFYTAIFQWRQRLNRCSHFRSHDLKENFKDADCSTEHYVQGEKKSKICNVNSTSSGTRT